MSLDKVTQEEYIKKKSQVQRPRGTKEAFKS